MLGRPDSGTSVDSVMLGAANSSIPPARTCDSISGSPPSWLLANTVMLTRPDDCAPTALAASTRRIVSGWVSGVLTPSLKSNSGAARTGLPNIVAASAADPVPSRPLRVIFFVFIIVFLPNAFRVWDQFRPSVYVTQGTVKPIGLWHETISRNSRNDPE